MWATKIAWDKTDVDDSDICSKFGVKKTIESPSLRCILHFTAWQRLYRQRRI